MFLELEVSNTAEVVHQNSELFSVKDLNHFLVRIRGRNFKFDGNLHLNSKALRIFLYLSPEVHSNLNISDASLSVNEMSCCVVY